MTNSKGFMALPAVLLMLGLIAIGICINLFTTDQDYNVMKTRRLLAARDDIAQNLATIGSTGAALRYSVALNKPLDDCVKGTCTAGIYDMILASPIAGDPTVASSAGVKYDTWEKICGPAPTPGPSPGPVQECPLVATAKFQITCSVGAVCGPGSASIRVIYSVEKTPGSTYPGVMAPMVSPTPNPVDVNCITWTSPYGVVSSEPAGCY